MSGSVFLSGWSVGGINSASHNDHNNGGRKARRTAGAVSQRRARHAADQGVRGVVTTLLALAGIRTRFQQVDYRNFRELLNFAIGGRVRNLGRDTYLYDNRNRLIAIKRAARFDTGGRCVPPCYFARRAV